MSHDSVTLDQAIFAKLIQKGRIGKMTVEQIIKYSIRQTLRQINEDYEIDIEKIIDDYVDAGRVTGDFIDLTEPTPVVIHSTALAIRGGGGNSGAARATCLSRMKKGELVEVCERMSLDFEGNVQDLRCRIRDAGGLEACPPARDPQVRAGKQPLALPGPSAKKVMALPGPSGKNKRKAGDSEDEPKKTKKAKKAVLSEEPMAIGPSRTKKVPIEKPVHNHLISEVGNECGVCDTYGNPLAVHPLTGRNPVEKTASAVVIEEITEEPQVVAEKAPVVAEKPKQVEGIVEDVPETDLDEEEGEDITQLTAAEQITADKIRAQLAAIMASEKKQGDEDEDDEEDGELMEE